MLFVVQYILTGGYLVVSCVIIIRVIWKMANRVSRVWMWRNFTITFRYMYFIWVASPAFDEIKKNISIRLNNKKKKKNMKMTSSTLHIPYCVTAMRILGKSYCLHFNSLCFSVDTTVEIRYILPRLTLSLCLSIYRQQLGGFIYHSTSLVYQR